MYVHACSLKGKETLCCVHAVHLRQAHSMCLFMFMFILWQLARFNREHSLLGHAAGHYHLSGVGMTAS